MGRPPRRQRPASHGRRAVLRLRGGRLALAVVLGALVCQGCRREREDPAARRSVREATITAEVRSRILASEGLEPLPLTVDTRGGIVHVSGSVTDSAQVEAVRAIARNVRGVERVELDVRVVQASDTTRSPVPRRTRPAPPPAAPGEPLPSLEEAG